MTIVYALVSRQKTVLAEYTATSGENREAMSNQCFGVLHVFFLSWSKLETVYSCSCID